MRENEGIRNIYHGGHLLDVVVRARFVARLFAAINYVTSRRKNGFFVGLGENAEEHIQGHNEEGY